MGIPSGAVRVVTLVVITCALAAACGGGGTTSSPSVTGNAAATSNTAASATDWAKVVEAANREGKVTVYIPAVLEVVQRMTQAFNKAYPGIKLEVSNTSELDVKIDQEHEANVSGADIYITPKPPFPPRYAKAGRLLNLIGPNALAFPSSAYYVPRQAPIVSITPYGIAYNKNLVKTAPKSLLDLLQPEFKGRLGAIAITAEDHGYTGALWWDTQRKWYGNDIWARLKAQDLKFYDSAGPMNQAVASGELLATVFSNTATANSISNQGAPLVFVLPTPPNGLPNLGLERYLVAFVKTQRPNATQVFADFMLSREGQAALNANGDSASKLSDIPGALPPLDSRWFDPDVFTLDVVDKITAEWRTFFNRK